MQEEVDRFYPQEEDVCNTANHREMHDGYLTAVMYALNSSLFTCETYWTCIPIETKPSICSHPPRRADLAKCLRTPHLSSSAPCQFFLLPPVHVSLAYTPHVRSTGCFLQEHTSRSTFCGATRATSSSPTRSGPSAGSLWQGTSPWNLRPRPLPYAQTQM